MATAQGLTQLFLTSWEQPQAATIRSSRRQVSSSLLVFKSQIVTAALHDKSRNGIIEWPIMLIAEIYFCVADELETVSWYAWNK